MGRNTSVAYPSGTQGTPPIPAPPVAAKRIKHPFVLGIILIVILLITGGIAYAVPGLLTALTPHHTVIPSPASRPRATPTASPLPAVATVTITPAHTLFKQSYTITEVTGAPNAAQNQVQGARIASASNSQSLTVNASGSGQTPATRATGSLTLSQPSQPVTIPAGTPFTSSSGVTVATSATVKVDLGSTISVGAYAVQAGPGGNIRAYDINTTSSYNGASFYVQNPAAFSGGKAGHSYPVVLQSDINGAVQQLTGPTTQAAQNALASQLLSNEQFVGNSQCNTSPSANHAAGDAISQVTVTVQATCQQEAYNPQPALKKAVDLLKRDLPKKLAGYTPVGQVSTTLKGTTPQDNSVSLSIDSAVEAVFQISDAQKQNMLQLIVGKSTQEAQALLSQQPGVLKVVITFSSGDGKTMPQETKNITMKVEAVQGSQSS